MLTNLFPAILLAGPPNCGKSVLSFLLTYRLRELRIAHYLLRAVPDGEGDWFQAGRPEIVQVLRTIHKTRYSSQFVDHMQSAIKGRLLPLLVDIGGRPQGEQLGLIKACTHSILLYRTEEERLGWREILAESKLLPVAELQSALDTEELIHKHQPYLRGIISGLERDETKRRVGMTFGALLERVAGICSYDEEMLEQEHVKHAPFPFQNERDLAKQLSVPVEGDRITWSPGHLRRLSEIVPTAQSLAIYGRGPVWLASALACSALPALFAIFDARYGWLLPTPIHFSTQDTSLNMKKLPFQSDDLWLDLEIPGGTIEPSDIIINPVSGNQGIVLSGKLPRWLFASLVHKLAPDHTWIAIDDPRLAQAIVVHSNSSTIRVGDVLPRLVK
jgi:CRISPR-associated protein Csx3